MIKCDKCNDGSMFILYDRNGIASYVCNKCDNKKTKYEIEQVEGKKQEEQKQQLAQTEINTKIQELKRIYDNEVYGYEDIKALIVDIVDQHLKGQLDKPAHIALIGASGTCKTFFFELMLKVFDNKTITMIDCSHLSSSGLVSYLNETGDYKTLNFIVLDELDKLEKKHQKALLIALESGILSEKKYKRNITLDVKDCLFLATGNERDKIYDPLLNRFTVLNIPSYTYQEYRKITDQWIGKKCPSNSIELLANLFPNNKDSEIIQIRTLKRLVDLSGCDPSKLVSYMSTIEKYST